MSVSTTVNKVVLAFAYLVGLVAAGFTIALYSFLLFSYSYGQKGSISTWGYLIHVGMILLALLAVWGIIKRKPVPVFIAFLGSLPMGLYVLATPGIIVWTTVFVTLYLIASALLVLWHVLRALR